MYFCYSPQVAHLADMGVHVTKHVPVFRELSAIASMGSVCVPLDLKERVVNTVSTSKDLGRVRISGYSYGYG